MRATALLARDSGTHRCFYCGGACSGELPASRHVKKTFLEWADVAAPGSNAVCAGCVVSMDERLALPGRDKPQKTRNYSWLVTDRYRRHYHKGQISELRQAALVPVEPPWALTLAVSGQRNVLWRCQVNLEHGPEATVQLETETITYRLDALADRLSLTTRIVAALGKPSLAEPLDTGRAIQLSRYHGPDGLALLESWGRVRHEPLSRLAAFLSPPKEHAKDEYPPATVGVA